MLDNWDWSILKINEELGRKEGMASDYGNLGNVYKIRGDLDKATEYCERSLKINEELGRKEGMAKQYGILGIVYQMRGELDKAREYWFVAHSLFKEIGSPKTDLIQGWLDSLSE
jgi:tetratricopeptide (TPR) repeat protein